MTAIHTLMSWLLSTTVRISVELRARLDRLLAEPEAGLDASTEKAIYIVGGVVVATAVIALITTFIGKYLAKLP
jgi:hypothetical protein